MSNNFLNKYEQKSDFVPPQNDEITEGSKKPKLSEVNKGIIIKAAIGAVALIMIAIAVFFMLNKKVVLDDMTGWKADDVNLWATENSVMLRYTESYSDEVASGLVISHSPSEGESVEKGKFLEIVVSIGSDPSILVEIPDFMEMTQSEIEAWETANFMTTVRITASNSKTVEQGKVISFTVNDTTAIGQEVRRDATVYIIMSNGTGESGNVTVPDFTAMTLDMAEDFAEDNEIIIEVEEVFDDMSVEGQIISQDIDMEEIIKIGDTVKLEVSKGPEIIVPDFSSYDADMAMTIASQNNMMVTLKEKYSSADAGKMISQSIAAGTLYDTDDILTLTYSLGNKIVIPSCVGQGIDTLTSWVDEYNELGTSMKVNITYTTSNDYPGTIMTQDKADSFSSISSTINVLVSEGKVVYVPDLVADQGADYSQVITREKALEICEEVGLIAVFVEEDSADRLEGEVWSQSISAGKEVQQGTTITLKYKPVKSTVTVPNFVGMTEAEVIASGYQKSFIITYEVMDMGDGMEDVTSAPVVTSQSVTAGTTVAPGQEIILQ